MHHGWIPSVGHTPETANDSGVPPTTVTRHRAAGLVMVRPGEVHFGLSAHRKAGGEDCMENVIEQFQRLNDTVMPYREASAFAKARDRRCMGCNHDGSDHRLETHHRNKDSYGPAGSYVPCRPSDLTTFCVPCHDLHTSADRKQRYENKDHSRGFGATVKTFSTPPSDRRPRVAAVFGGTLPAAPRIDP